jgi:nitrous oxidase accessory protein NosD
MSRMIRLSMLSGMVVACMAVAAPAWGMSKTVCSSGCPYTSIQAAINAASPGATITIAAGSYSENVVVNKPVTLKGAGNATVIYPATSNPICSSGSLCGGAASNIILVEADNVTITNLRLQGDNPSLTSGIVVGGEDIDARNGIITNHAAGVYNNLTVSKVKITGIYLRGIYASSGGSFNFNHDTIDNVQGEANSIAMFNFGGSGVMADNKVTNANDAISANHSTGTQFLHNLITKSGSGVHSDNNGDSGGSADLIQGNKVRECNTDGYGIFVFVPYLSPTVEGNKVKGCYVGIAGFGGAVAGQGATFAGNSVNGVGATTTDPNGTYGAYLTTDQLGFGSGDLTATLTGNTFVHSGTGMFVTQEAGSQATISASGNSFMADGTGANGGTGTVVTAANNWWGCTQGPNMGGHCTTATGTVQFTPWLTARP